MTRSAAIRLALAALTGGLAVAAIGFALAGTEPQRPATRGGAGWGALSPSPLARTEVGAGRIGDRIYVVGGYVSSGGSTGALAIYDISDDSWSEGRALPIAVNHPGVTAHRGKLYVLGGNRPSPGQAERRARRLYSYSPGRNRWRRLADAPTARGALGLAGIGDRLYAAGGYTASDDTVRKLEIFDLSKRRWRRGAPMSTGRNHVAAARLDGKLIVTGGRPGPEHGGLATVESYDPERNRWRTLAPLTTARSGHAAAVAGGSLVVFGGEELDGGSTIEQVERFDPASGSWTSLAEMPTPRHGVGGAAFEARVFALEGGPQPGLSYSSALEYLDLP